MKGAGLLVVSLTGVNFGWEWAGRRESLEMRLEEMYNY